MGLLSGNDDVGEWGDGRALLMVVGFTETPWGAARAGGEWRLWVAFGGSGHRAS